MKGWQCWGGVVVGSTVGVTPTRENTVPTLETNEAVLVLNVFKLFLFRGLDSWRLPYPLALIRTIPLPGKAKWTNFTWANSATNTSSSFNVLRPTSSSLLDLLSFKTHQTFRFKHNRRSQFTVAFHLFGATGGRTPIVFSFTFFTFSPNIWT